MGFSQNLQTLMQESGITDYKLAKTIGVHATTVKNWKQGRIPTAVHAQRVANFFNITVDSLLKDPER